MNTLKLTFLVVNLFVFSCSFSQKKKTLFSKDLEKFTLRCQAIGEELINKSKVSNAEQWFEGDHLSQVIEQINQLEQDIDHSDLEVTYHLILMAEEPWIYTLHFYNEETKTEFGQLFIRFNDKENDLAEYLAFISKEKLKAIDDRLKADSGFLNIPPPPPPPPPSEEKKKNH